MRYLSQGGVGMNFDLTKEQKMIQRMVSDFAEKKPSGQEQ